MKLKSTDKLTKVTTGGCLIVNDKPFVVEFPDEVLFDVEDNRLVTYWRGCLRNYWKPEEIEGYYA